MTVAFTTGRAGLIVLTALLAVSMPTLAQSGDDPFEGEDPFADDENPFETEEDPFGGLEAETQAAKNASLAEEPEADEDDAGETPEPSDEDPETGSETPGLGTVAALAAIGLAGWLCNRRR